jgi:hypothetical protein
LSNIQIQVLSSIPHIENRKMNREIIIFERFKLFFSMLGISKSELARKLNISNQNINKLWESISYIQSKSMEINELGCNLNWLYTGNGKVTSDNENGYKLNNTVTTLTNDGFLKSQLVKNRIIAWIKFNYISIDDFYNFSKNEDVLSLKNICNESVDNEIIKNSIYFSLEEAGCNLHWILSEDNDTPFNNNPNGLLFKDKYYKNKESRKLLSELLFIKISEHNLN